MAMDWRPLLSLDDGYACRPGVSGSAISAAEARLRTPFPLALRELLAASDGVFDRAGQWFVLWPLARIVENNEDAWAAGTPVRRELLGFGDDGTGAPFCVRLDGSSDVFIWSPIEGTAVRLADDLACFWSAWAANVIST